MYRKLFKSFTERANLLLVVDHAGRAGNGFFLSIFDQHEQVLSCPWVHYVYSYCLTLFGDGDALESSHVLDVWSKQKYFNLLHDDLSAENRAFILKVGGDPAAPMDRSLVRTVFRDIILARPTISRRELILATYFSFALGIGRDTEAIEYVLVSDSISLRTESVFAGYSGRIVDLVLEDFPTARLFHLIRDPRAGFASTNHQFINQLGNMYGLRLGNALSRLVRTARMDFNWDSFFVFGFFLMYFRQTFEAIMRKRAEHATSFTVIRNEDLNCNFRETMKSVSSMLGIKHLEAWDLDEHFMPTMLGIPWRGTGAYNSRYSPPTMLQNDPASVCAKSVGPNKHVTVRWKSRLKPSEIYLIETFLRPEFDALGYDLLTTSGSWRSSRWLLTLLKPLRGELPSVHWVAQGWSVGWRLFMDRLFFSIVWPVYYILVRLSFAVAVYTTNVFEKDCFAGRSQARESLAQKG
ncbi:MAG: sulfotransferase [Proteobacteria bacterium]|nr:sulfotransferase [Pseudomonadota bacterium]